MTWIYIHFFFLPQRFHPSDSICRELKINLKLALGTQLFEHEAVHRGSQAQSLKD